LGTEVEKLGFPEFLAHPLGVMIDGEAWLRSGVRVQDDALFFACSVVEGAELHFMKALDLVQDTRSKLLQVEAEMGSKISGGLFWNCAYRMLEAQIKGQEQAYHEVLSPMTHMGLHSNGESYVGHINQTLTGLVFCE
jgi:hypothetical protein